MHLRKTTGKRANSRRVSLGLAASILVAVTVVCTGCPPTFVEYHDIGALMPLTGDLADFGSASAAALELAETDVNAALAASGAAGRVRLVVADTGTEAEAASWLMHFFISQNIRVVIGPFTSEETLAVEGQVNASDTVMISPSSTLPELAVVDDNILRLAPDDTHAVAAVVAALQQDGIENLVILYRGDAWGTSLATNTKIVFEAAGGTVLGSAEYFGFRQSIMNAALTDLSDLIVSADNEEGTTGFMLISFAEGGMVMELASEFPVLSALRWYGSDGYTQGDGLLANATASAFAVQTQYVAPVLGLELSAEGLALRERIEEATGVVAGVYSLLAYDAFSAAANVLVDATASISVADLRTQLIAEIESLDGVTGTVDLNAAGDRAGGDYFFWQVVEESAGSHAWESAFSYQDGQIVVE